MNILCIHHVSVITADTGRALQFYQGVLGLQCDDSRPDLGYPGAWLRVGDGQIHLLELSNPDPAEGRPAHGGRDRHLALLVTDLEALRRALDQAGIRPVTRQAPRHFRHFRIPTDVSFEPDEPNRRTILQLITADRPGLLSVVARVFTQCGVILQNARISTFGVRAEDVFYITDRRRQPLRDKHQFDCLEEQLQRQLDA